MKNSGINWTDHTANFWWGCMKVSDGCKNCYAETLSKRYGKSIWGPPATTKREFKKSVWQDIFKWDEEARAEGIRRRVFVSSMSDFLEDHPQVNEWREHAKIVIRRLTHLDILMLTKRPENAPLFLGDWWEEWPAHVWMGTTVENQKAYDERIDILTLIPAPIHFLSVEPMLEPIYFYNHLPSILEVEWIICGGESGPRARPFEWDWARDIAAQCGELDIAFWMKQGGGIRPPHELHELPEDLRIRELPTTTQ
jgi:protein gp37